MKLVICDGSCIEPHDFMSCICPKTSINDGNQSADISAQVKVITDRVWNSFLFLQGTHLKDQHGPALKCPGMMHHPLPSSISASASSPSIVTKVHCRQAQRGEQEKSHFDDKTQPEPSFIHSTDMDETFLLILESVGAPGKGRVWADIWAQRMAMQYHSFGLVCWDEAWGELCLFHNTLLRWPFL